MKQLFIALIGLFICLGPITLLGDAAATPLGEHGTWAIEAEAAGMIMFLDQGDPNYLTVWLNAGIGANFCYSGSDRFELKAGISNQQVNLSRHFDHPYPYVVEMYSYLKSRAIRVSASGNWNFRRMSARPAAYIGAGFFTDMIHSAWLENKIVYVSESYVVKHNVKDSFDDILPGIQIQTGFRGPQGRIELRFWTDLIATKIQGLPAAEQRRFLFGINVSIFLYHSAK